MTPRSRATEFIARMETRNSTEVIEALHAEVLETSGTLLHPHGETSHLWELTLHDITGTGLSEDEAVANWLRLARRTGAAPPSPEPIDDARASHLTHI